MAQTVYTLCAVSINGTILNQIVEQDLPVGFMETLQSSDGNVDATFAAAMAINPKFTFRTTAIDSFLALCGINGLAISSNVILYYYQMAAQGIKGAGSVHRSATIATGMVIPRKIVAAQNKEATLEFDVFAISSDGLAAPVTFANNIALPTLSGVQTLFTLGPLKINATFYDGVQSFDFDFGIREKVLSHSGLVYPLRMHIESRQPGFRWKINDASMLPVLGLTGLAVAPGTGSDAQCWLRKILSNSTRVANATAQHISFTFRNGIWKVTRVAGSNPSEQSADLELKPISDNTNPIVAISTAAAIS